MGDVMRATSMRILMTGATSGIGLAAARQLLAEGHELIVICRDPERASQRLMQPTARNPADSLADLTSGSNCRHF